MFNLSGIHLHLSGNPFLLVVLLAAGVLFSLYAYRQTIPPVSRNWRVFFVVLRSFTIALLILLLFQPILSIVKNIRQVPVVAVLIDDSASMGLVDQKVDRARTLKSILASDLFRSSSDAYRFEFWPFSSHLENVSPAVPDSLELAGDGTDIAAALTEVKQKLSEEYFTSVVLLTDGADNLGENPARSARELGVPVYPIGVGDPSEQKDILISNYVTNEVAYAGTRIPVDVFIKNTGFSGQRITVKLLQDQQLLDRKLLDLAQSGLEQKVRLYFTPQKEGLTKYEISLPRLQDELTPANNSKTFYVNVLKNKLNVVLVAGGPSADYKFLHRVLSEDENISLQAFLEKHDGKFYKNRRFPSEKQLAKTDCFILLDYPRASSNATVLNTVGNLLRKGKPLLYLHGENVDLDRLAALKDALPFSQPPRKGREFPVYLKVDPQGRYHPWLKLSEDDFENSSIWAAMPPVFTNVRSVKLNPLAKSLASVDIKRSTGFPKSAPVPIIVAQTRGKRKNAAILAYGLWRWSLLLQGFGKTDVYYRHFIQNVLRWLTAEEEGKLVKITSNKRIYRSAEQVEFTAEVYFEDYSPAENAEVTVQVQGTQGVQEISLDNVGGGRYKGNLQVLEGGDYAFTGTAHQQGRLLGQDKGKFSVEEFSLEFQNTRMNADLLQKIAAESKGKYFDSSDFADLKNYLHFPEKTIISKKEFEIWNRVPLLVMCLALMGLEWYVRKRKGML